MSVLYVQHGDTNSLVATTEETFDVPCHLLLWLLKIRIRQYLGGRVAWRPKTPIYGLTERKFDFIISALAVQHQLI